MEGDAGTGRLNPDDVPTEDDDVSRLAGRGWLIGVCATLVVLAAVVATGGYFALRSNQDAQSLTRAEAQATQAAKDCVAATQAPNVAAMAESQQKILDCATGDYSAQATLYSGVLVEAYQAANAQVEVTDLQAAVERHNGDGSMDVLVALRVKLSNSEVQQQETGYRLRVLMAPDNGTYKIARLDQVTT
jgi:Mce-associated membrane protein